MTVYRGFSEKKKAYATEAEGVRTDLETALRRPVEAVRIVNRYDIENIDPKDFELAARTILSEPQVDHYYNEEAPSLTREQIPVPSAFNWQLARKDRWCAQPESITSRVSSRTRKRN